MNMIRRILKPSGALRAALLLVFLSIPAFSGVIFDNINGACSCYSVDGLNGSEFTPSATYQLTDVAAFMGNFSSTTQTVDFFIYSDASGVPGVELTALTGTIPGVVGSTTQAEVNSGAPSIPLTLVSGTNYWFVVDLTNTNLGWEDGSSEPPYAFNSGGGWVALGPQSLGYEIDGSLTTPEPGTLALAGVGLVLAIVGRRRRAA
jgi:PEP-CTERM motif